MSRLKSGSVAAALVAALSLPVASAQSNMPSSSPAARRKFDQKLKIESRYNKAVDTTLFSLSLKKPDSLTRLARGGSAPNIHAPTQFSDDVAIFAYFSHPGKSLALPVEEANLWIVYTGGARLAVTSELRALVDGQDVLLSSEVVDNSGRLKDGSTRIGSLTLPVRRPQLAQLANASEVTLVLPSGERIILSREQLDALADFESRMSP